MLLAFSNCTCQDEKSNTLITKFIGDLGGDQTSLDQVIIKYLAVEVRDGEAIDFVKIHLQFAREELKREAIAASELQILKYKDASEKYKNISINDEQSNNTYLVFFRNQFLMPVLIRNGKIHSFATIDKGGKRFFLMYE
jgi:hypothetical protein